MKRITLTFDVPTLDWDQFPRWPLLPTLAGTRKGRYPMKRITLTFDVPTLDWDRLALLVRAELIPRGILPTDQDVIDYVAHQAEGVLAELVSRAETVEQRDRLIAAGDIEIGRPAAHLRLIP